MTREEAIERFNGIINAMSISVAQSKFYPSKAELNELCAMAIKALSEPSGDLISKQYAIEQFCKLGTSLERQGKTMITMVDAKYAFIKTLESLPSAEPKTGKWIKATGMMSPEFHGHHYCSECGNFANMEPPLGNREDLSNFCPNCNADMRGENK